MSGVKLSSVLPGMTLTATVTKVSSLFSISYHIVRYQNARCPLLSYGTGMKHPVPDRVKPSYVIFDIWAL